MLARRLTAILPAMSLAEALETTQIHRVADLTSGRAAVVSVRPFWAPHPTISVAEDNRLLQKSLRFSGCPHDAIASASE